MMNQTGRTRAASVARVLCFGVLMTVLVAAELYLHYKTIPVFLEYLQEAEHKNSAWIGGQISFMLPFLTVAFFQYAVYCRAERAGMPPDTVCPAKRLYQREKAVEILLVAVLVYGVLLPYCVHLSNEQYAAALAEAARTGDILPQTDCKVDDKLIYHLAEWFLRLGVPLGLLGIYHGARARDCAEECRNGEQEA